MQLFDPLKRRDFITLLWRRSGGVAASGTRAAAAASIPLFGFRMIQKIATIQASS
jgi:hypothetical protein